MVKPELIYGDLKDKYVAKVVLYGHSDNVLYYDKEHTTAITHDELMDLCKKGLVLVTDGTAFYYPVIFKDATTKVTVTVATSIGTGSSTSKDYESKDPVE